MTANEFEKMDSEFLSQLRWQSWSLGWRTVTMPGVRIDQK